MLYCMETFEEDWKTWIDTNIQLGSCKKIMFQKLLDRGYSYQLIRRTLGIDYFTNRVALRTANKINARNIELYTIDNFLTTRECEQIIRIMQESGLVESTTVSGSIPHERAKTEHRTSQTCHFSPNDDFMQDVDSRICKTIGINNRFAECIQGQQYSIGQQFKLHTDFFDKQVLDAGVITSSQRTWTFMIYLNDVEEGGHTSFPYAFASFVPKVGMAVIWNNLDDKRCGNVFSSHCGMPIIKGEKYIITKWFKEFELQTMICNEICDHHFLPIFHPIGFEKIAMKLHCIEEIKEWMLEHEHEFVDETLADTEIHSNMRSRLLMPPQYLLDNLQEEFKRILTQWICYKAELTHTYTYGIREYLRGSSLGNHYDKIQTHVISAIIHLGDTSDKPWDLYIEDHSFRPHHITMEYGDIVFYESTTCLHGRPTAFEGDSHRNMYIHFKPERW
jgi:prolyl 4-hydroxylase